MNKLNIFAKRNRLQMEAEHRANLKCHYSSMLEDASVYGISFERIKIDHAMDAYPYLKGPNRSGHQEVCDSDIRKLNSLADECIIARATDAEEVFVDKVKNLIASIRSLRENEGASRFLKERDELKAKLERTERNCDMWRGQCERQAKKLAELKGIKNV